MGMGLFEHEAPQSHAPVAVAPATRVPVYRELIGKKARVPSDVTGDAGNPTTRAVAWAMGDQQNC